MKSENNVSVFIFFLYLHYEFSYSFEILHQSINEAFYMVAFLFQTSIQSKLLNWNKTV